MEAREEEEAEGRRPQEVAPVDADPAPPPPLAAGTKGEGRGADDPDGTVRHPGGDFEITAAEGSGAAPAPAGAEKVGRALRAA